jgi:hypothetical protein
VFAQNLRINNEQHPAEARGQLIAFRDGEVEVRDELSAQALTFRVGTDTIVRHNDQPASPGDLRPGSVVSVRFSPARPGHDIAREINIIAASGSLFQFAGKVTYLDMSRGLLALQNRANDTSYEIGFNPQNSEFQELGVGSEVQMSALFDGAKYTAQSVTVMPVKASSNGQKH